MPNKNNVVDRRDFLRYAGLTGAAFILGMPAVSAKDANALANLSDAADLYNLSPYIIIEKSGQITLFNTKPDMGQGTFQSIPALIAEELEVSPQQYIVKQTGGESKFGKMQFSGGSFSVRMSYMEMRKVGAAAREMLITAASQKWGVPITECYAENAKIYHKPSGKSVGYGDLAEAAAKLEVPKEPKLKEAKDFKLLGKSLQRQDIPLKVSGKAVFGIDVEVPNMVYATIERCPVFGATLVDFDAKAALKVEGVEKVIAVERTFGNVVSKGVAVIAKNYWAAVKGRKVLKINWNYNGKNTFNSKDYEQSLRDLAKTDGVVAHNAGDFDKVFKETPNQIEAFYETPFVSHSPMEPMNCLADWKPNNQLEVWTSTQNPSDIMDKLSKQFALKEGDLKINVTFNGGGFGRRLFVDFVGEAAQLSKNVQKPVKLIWSREDDTEMGPFRPPTFSALKGAVSAEGKAVAFQHKVISPSIDYCLNATYDKTKPDKMMTEGISEQKYEIPNMKNLYVFSELHVPVAYWRSVTSATLAFAQECFIDEMAVKAGKDPLDFRLSLLTKDSDTKRVLLKLREISNWDTALPAGKGRGVAQWEFFAGLGGNVVEVTKQADGSIKIDKVLAVIDLGTVVNPDNVRAQVKGAIVMGITAAVKNGITFANGRAEQSNFHNNPILRIHEMPKIEVHILAEGGKNIKGVGEPGLPPVAPALANAIFKATGKRIRRMPFDLEK
jgi:isoquinoline 1-oxidoreductase subunit beta